MPNFRGRRFTNAHETLIWCTKERNQKRYTFNYNAMKALNEDLQRATAGERTESASDSETRGASLSRDFGRNSGRRYRSHPFFGTGTTGVVAKRLRRRYIGIERDETYVTLARERLAAVTPGHLPDLDITEGNRAEPRIPFGQVLERGLLAVDRDAPVGFSKTNLTFDLDTDADADAIANLLKLTERFCVVYQTLKSSPAIEVAHATTKSAPAD